MKLRSMHKKFLILIIGGLLMLGLFGCDKNINLKNSRLVWYRYSSYGGMTGGGYSEEIGWIGDEVIMTVESSQFWNEDPTVEEYVLDPAVLNDIETVFKKYKMQRWEGKTFSNIVVYDGPTFGYSFRFEDGTQIGFSSQSFPEFYYDKLSEIGDVIRSYTENVSPEPEFISIVNSMEEIVSRKNPDNGQVSLEAFKYSRNYIYFRILNGTDEDISIDAQVKLVRNEDGEVLYDKTLSYADEIFVYANSSEEKSALLTDRLKVGTYTLYVADYSAEFEIRTP